MKKIGLGIIGCGHVSRHHARGYLSHPEIEIVATCDIFKAKAIERAREWGAKRVYTDYHEILRDSKVDLVGIYTNPLSTHKSIAIEAAEAGKHISCQKPMALSIKDADQVIDTVRRTGIKYQYSEPDIWLPAITRIKEMIDAGDIGQPRYISLIPSQNSPVISSVHGRQLTPERYAKLKREHYIRVACRRRILQKEPHLLERGDLELYDLEDVWIGHVVHWTAAVYYLFGVVEKVTAIKGSPVDILNSIPVIGWKHSVENRFGAWIGPSAGWSIWSRIDLLGSKGLLSLTNWLGGKNCITLHQRKNTIETNTVQNLGYFWPTTRLMARNHIDSIIMDKEPKLSVEDGKEILRFALAIGKSAKEEKTISINDLE